VPQDANPARSAAAGSALFLHCQLTRHSQARPHAITHDGQREKAQKIGALNNEVLVNPSVAHAELIASYRRAQADAAHKFGLIKTIEKKGPKAIEAAIETAAKAAKRRDSFAKKLNGLGVSLED
jgi:hypothetical protein